MEQDRPKKLIVVAGATGQLGEQIMRYLLENGASVKALVRKGTPEARINSLAAAGGWVVEVDFANEEEIQSACRDASCVVSALSGLEDVIVTLQHRILRASVEAGVPRFIPSDYCIDFTKLPQGSNRNLDLRRQFAVLAAEEPIQLTSILNGMFTDLLLEEAPLVLFGPGRILFWGNADQPMDFTTITNTAEYTAKAALDDDTPRYLRIAGEVATIRDLQRAATKATGKAYKLFRMGGLGVLKLMINVTRTLFPQRREVFPAWQGMQYLYDMLSGLPKFESLDNHRYQGMVWTGIADVLRKRGSYRNRN